MKAIRFYLSLFLSGILLFSCQDSGELYKGRKVLGAKFGECKNFTRGMNTDTIAQDLSCVYYSYDASAKTLNFTHYNTAFNCCISDVKVEISVDENVITIKQMEKLSNGGCYCDCLYDITFTLKSLEPGAYTIHIIEPYLGVKSEELLFDVDLKTTSSGMVCKNRTTYPWNF